MSLAKEKENDFITLSPIPGGNFDEFVKSRHKIQKMPKNSDDYLNLFVDTYGVDAVENMEEVNIGDYVMDKGTIYALNMNVGRAIPWIEDGLKSVERRVLWIMYKSGLYKGKSDKVSGVVGDMLKYVHPHSDLAAADTVYRLGRDRACMIPYIKPGGNFGNMDTMRPASQRYASASLSNYAYECFFSEMGAKHPIFDVKDNYKFSEKEPVYLTSKYPNVLMQWNQGIGKGAAAWLGAFNSKDIFKVALKMLDDPDCKVDIYPDLPVPCEIVNKNELKHCFDKSHFKVRMRGQYHQLVDKKYDSNGKIVDKYCLVFTSMPLTVIGKTIYDEIRAINAKDKTRSLKERRLPEVLNVEVAADDITPGGIQIFIEYEKGYDPNVLAEKLYRSTSLEKVIGVQYNMITDNTPDLFTPREIMKRWIAMRFDQKRRYYHQQALRAARERAKYDAICTVLESSSNTDDAINIIRKASTNAEAIKNLMSRFKFTEFQARCIIELQLKNLPKMDIEVIKAQRDKAQAEYKEYRTLLTKPDAIKNKITEELEDGLKKYGKDRKALVKSLKEDDQAVDTTKKCVIYTDSGFTCISDGEEAELNAAMSDKTSRYVEFQNSQTVAVIGRDGLVKILNGFAFKPSRNLLNFEPLVGFKNVASIIPFTKNLTHAAVVTSNGFAKIIATDVLFANTRSKIINLGQGETVAGVVPINNNETTNMILFASADTCLYYNAIEKVPVLTRAAAGNRVFRMCENKSTTGVPDKLTRVWGISTKRKDLHRVAVFTEYGYMKFVDVNTLKFDKKAPTVSDYFDGKYIMNVIPIFDDETKGDWLYHFSESLAVKINYSKDNKPVAYTIIIGTHNTTKRLGTSLSAPVKIYTVGRNEWYYAINIH